MTFYVKGQIKSLACVMSQPTSTDLVEINVITPGNSFSDSQICVN